MQNYLLFKQVASLILFIETLIVWPKFRFYFGLEVFPKTIFTTFFRVHLFNVFLLASLICLFLNTYSIVASFIVFICMRYLYVTHFESRISTLGAVGHITYFTSAYIFFFEVAFAIDPSGSLANFIRTILAIEMGIMMVSAGIHKCLSGYLNGRGFEYALVNPSWGKFFFLFKKLRPSSQFFKWNNYGSIFLELLTGLCFFIPQTRIYGAYLLQFLFLYVLLTVRANILPWLMICLSLLYILPLSFHFPTLNQTLLTLPIPEYLITGVKILFIIYLIFYIFVSFLRLVQVRRKISFLMPSFLVNPLIFFMSKRPFFEWSVFSANVTDYFIQIQKVSKTTKEMTSMVYEGFSKNYREVFEDPRSFFRFIHHHESSFLLHLFAPLRYHQIVDRESESKFVKKVLMYAKTHLSNAEIDETDLLFIVTQIRDIHDEFTYVPVGKFLVDVKSNRITLLDI